MLDWGTIGLTDWTKGCITIIANEFHLSHQKGVFPTIQHIRFNVNSASEIIRNYTIYLKRDYNNWKKNGAGASQAKVVAEQRARSLGRRQQLLHRRKAMVKHHQFPDIAVQLLDKLDKEGMSSEESEGEPGTTERVYRIKKLPWRSPEVTQWLHRVDAMPTKNTNGAVLSRMASYRTRVTSDLESDSRPPIRCLLKTLYRPEWLRLQLPSSLKDLSVSNVKVTLPKIDDFAPVSFPDSVACPWSNLLTTEIKFDC